MEFHTKLTSLRGNRNLSQEKLAEAVGVSRQSVAKWESGDSWPEIDKLAALSRLFGVTIDSLVKEEEECSSVPGRSAKVPLQTDAAIEFLCRAKRATYAGHGAEVASTRSQSHDLIHQEGDLLYHDSFLGSEQFAGEEGLWKDRVPVWSMNYLGRVLGAGFSGDFSWFSGREVIFFEDRKVYECLFHGGRVQ